MTNQNFIQHIASEKSIFLQAELIADNEATVYQAYILFTRGDFSVQLPIEVVIMPCYLLKVYF